MKILKFILFLFLALALIFFAFGLMKPSVGYGYKIMVDKSVAEAWAVTQDESKYPQWLEGFESMEHISGEKFKVGSKYKIIVNPGEGQEKVEMIETIKSIKENDHIKMHFDSEMMDFEQTINFGKEGGKTFVATDSKVMAKSIFLKSFFAIMETFGGAFTKQEGKNMENLKKVINQNKRVYR